MGLFGTNIAGILSCRYGRTPVLQPCLPFSFMRCARQGGLGARDDVAMERTFRLSAGVYMIVRSLRLFPETFWLKLEGKKGGKGLRITFDRVGLDELCTVHK